MTASPLPERIIIAGAGFAGRSLKTEIGTKFPNSQVVSFLDDDPALIGTTIDGAPVHGPMDDSFSSKIKADQVIIAIPSATRGQLRRIFQFLRQHKIDEIKILPGISQILDGEAHLIMTRELDPLDLLGRNPVHIPLKKSLNYLRGKRVLITGAGGSIGSELSRQLLSGGASRLYLLGHGENSIVSIHREILDLQKEGVGEEATVIPIIGDIKDAQYTRFLLNRLKADVIFHCAAHKHVHLMEENTVENIHNNLFGTKNLLDSAKASGVRRFVLISTDKAVSPSSVYGVSKKLSEEVVLSESQEGLDFMVVRFGNVLGSRGSILPLFKKQIETGGPLTLTHPEATRFFMTIPEASSLVLQAAGVGQGGELYVLDMGTPLKIQDIARQMIDFYAPGQGDKFPMKVIGLRAGEKLHEALWEEDEEPVPTDFPRINRLIRSKTPELNLTKLIRALEPIVSLDAEQESLYRNRRALRKLLKTQFPSLLEREDEQEY
jgi:FlaA1/EpsC-like NDP-sugar epimerase